MVWSVVKAIPIRRTYLEATVQVVQRDGRVEREENQDTRCLPQQRKSTFDESCQEWSVDRSEVEEQSQGY